MVASIVQGLLVLLRPDIMLYMLAAMASGLVFGILPGLAGLTLLAILIPFTWGMDPYKALAFLMAGYAVCYTGGSVTAILLNIPGTGPNAATLVDGFPMTQKGEAGRALGAALTASAMGGVLGGLVLALLIPVVMPIVMAFGSPECFFLVVMGISFIAALGRESMLKAFIAGLLGLFVSFSGYHAGTGFARYTLGMTYLLDGVKIIPCALAVFALPEMIALMYRGGAIVKKGTPVNAPASDIKRGAKDVFQHLWLFIRSSIIGTFVGVIPGVGGDVAVWVAYGHAKTTSKHPEEFGLGTVEGVIAPESCNNAKEGGGLLPTLALGIPGSSAMAILLGAFLIVGIQPGPGFLQEHLDVAFTMVGALVLGNIVGTGVCMLAATKLVKITQVRAQLLAPFILCIISLGAFCARNSIFDIFLMYALGMVGWAMRELGYSRPAFFLGFVLGGIAERYFDISLASYGWTFFLTPISLGLIAITIFGVALEPTRAFLRRRKAQ
ncbi:MAG: tripartite tricarboxylate transporter permease [Deltaproteobacteria bacterium]|nr:tripartite tricarboxylate transporter permease [Deltaproteobacteria bacterium]